MTTDKHWFDTLNASLVQDADRRGILRAAGAIFASLALGGGASLTAAKRNNQGDDKKASTEKNGGKGKGGRKGSKGKGGGKGNKNDKDKKKRKPDPSCQDVCRQEFEFHPEEIPECVRKCNSCRLRHQFCVVEGNVADPTKIATCCYEDQQCCQDSFQCAPRDAMCCPGYPGHYPAPFCEKGTTCCASGAVGCCPDGNLCCPGTGCVNGETDSNNCGTCDNRCPDGYTCIDGDCVCVSSSCQDPDPNPYDCRSDVDCYRYGVGLICIDGTCTCHPSVPHHCREGEHCINTQNYHCCGTAKSEAGGICSNNLQCCGNGDDAWCQEIWRPCT
jgi:hypothetical protein